MVLYNSFAVGQLSRDPDAYWDDFEDTVLGFMSFSDSDDCNGVYEVNKVVAKSGYGPYLYDVALHFAKVDGMPGLVPDRKQVSPAAQRVWAFYFSKRKDVDKVPLENPSRSCNNPKGGPLNYVYSMTRPLPWVKRLQANHKVRARSLVQAGIHYNAYEFEMHHLMENGEAMFPQ